MPMHNPPHPGKVLRDYLGDMDIADAAKRLRVTRTDPVPHRQRACGHFGRDVHSTLGGSWNSSRVLVGAPNGLRPLECEPEAQTEDSAVPQSSLIGSRDNDHTEPIIFRRVV